MIKSVIFDMDGTLFQTDKILQLALDDTFEHLRAINKWDAESPIDTFREIMGAPLPKVWQTLLPAHSEEDRQYTDQYFLEKLLVNIREGNGALYPNVPEVFRYLTSKGHSIYIASNGLTAYLNEIIRYYELDQWVTETFSIQQIDTLDKSDLVGKIVKKYSITDGIVVGDRLSDIKAAKQNGLLSVGCNFDFAQEDELVQADVVINDLLELLPVLSS